jgi:hypothetical protein
MARRLRDDEECDLARTAIAHLMRRAWSDLQPRTGFEPMPRSFDFHLELPRDDVEKLSCAAVAMPHLFGARRHALLDDA